MQEVGKTRTTCGKILSIQSQLDGLSFYCGNDKKYSYIETRRVGASEASVIVKEIEGEEYEQINYYHNSSNYILLPRPLFDENMCDAYLLTKGIAATQDEVIRVTLTTDLACISLIDKAMNDINPHFNVLPLIAKCYHYGVNSVGETIAYIIVDGLLHLCYSKGKVVQFCETLPLDSSSDFEFFLGEVIRKYNLKKNYKIEQLFSVGSYLVGSETIDRYNIFKMVQENYNEL